MEVLKKEKIDEELLIPTILTEDGVPKIARGEGQVQVEYVQLGDYLAKHGYNLDPSALESFENSAEGSTTTVILTSPSNHRQVVEALVNQGGDGGETQVHCGKNSKSKICLKKSEIPDPAQALSVAGTHFAKLLPNSPVPIQIVKPQQQKSVASLSELIASTAKRLKSDESPPSTEVVLSKESTSPVPLIRRRHKNPIPDTKKDEKYWNRRIKNNIAAQRSRESRKKKEFAVMKKAEFLEKEYQKLSAKMECARDLNRKLRERLLKYESVDDIPEI